MVSDPECGEWSAGGLSSGEWAGLSAAIADQRLLLTRGTAARFAGLLDWPAVNAILDSGGLRADAAPPDIKIFRNGVGISERFWFAPFPHPRIDPPALVGLLRQGATIVLNAIHWRHRPIRAVQSALSRAFQSHCWVNAYLTFGDSFGFRPHFDPHDVIVLQVSGAKQWRIFGRREHLPVDRSCQDQAGWDDDPGLLVEEFRLNSGDMLFVPRGQWHAARNSDDGGGPSVHLTCGIEPPRGMAMVDALRRRALETPLFRRDPPRGADGGTAADLEAEIKAALHALVDQLSLTDLQDRWRIGDDGAQAPSEDAAVAPPSGRFTLPDLGGGGR